jgi:hypothetical protein
MSFFTGFATGLAKSVDTQLKESIERTRDNIDMVSKWRLKKAEERERERKAKDKEIQTLIQDAAYVISGNQNDVDAQNIAAALYKERGLSGFTDDIAFMREQSKTGVRPIDFIQRASIDVPANKFGLSEIVRSLSDAESSFAASDMVFPKGTIKGSGLIGAIVPDFDVTAAGGAQAKEQMQQIGFTTTPTAPSLSFDRYTFDREGMNYSSMSTNDKLAFLNDVSINPASTEPEREKARKRRDALLALAIEQGDDETALKAVDQRLSLMEPLNADGSENVDYTNALSEKQRIGDKLKLEQAQLEGEAAVLRTQALIAARDGYPAKATRLNREADDLDAGGFVPYETQIARLDEDIQRNISKHGDRYRNSEGPFAGKGMAEDIAIRNRLKTDQANLAGTTRESVNAAFNEIYLTAKKNLQINNPKLASALAGLSDIDMTDPANLGKILKVLEDSGVNSTEEFKKALEASVETVMNQAVAEGWNTKSVTLAAQKFQGLDLPALAGGAAETGAGTGAGADEGDAVVTQTDTILDAQEQTTESIAPLVLSSEEKAGTEKAYANSVEGALKMLDDGLSIGDTFSDISNLAGQVHDPSFNTAVTETIAKLEAAADNAIVGNTSQTPGTMFGVGADVVTINPVKKDTVVNDLAKDQGISTAAAEALVDSAVEKVNKPLDQMTAADASTENVMKVLDQEDLIALGGGVAPMRFKRAVSAIASNFNMEPAEAEAALNRALRVTKELKEAQRDPDFAERFSSGTLMGQIDVGEFKPENILTDAFKDVPGDSSDSAPTKFKPSAIQLAMKFIDGTLEGAERSLFRKELTGPNGKELAAAIQMIRDRRKAEQEVSAYRSRGGLMGR